MKKAMTILLAALLLSAPAIITHLALQSSSSLIALEYEKQLTQKLERELHSQSQATNILFEISQNLTFFKQTSEQKKYITEAGTAKNELVTLLGKYSADLYPSTGLPCETSITVNNDCGIEHISYKNGHKTSNTRLEKLTDLMMQFRSAILQKSQITLTREALKQFLVKEFKSFFNLYFFEKDEASDDINRIVLRENDSLKLLITMYQKNAYMMNALFDLSKISNEYLAKRKTSLWKNQQTGLLCITHGDNPAIFSSDYFADKPGLLKTIIKATKADSPDINGLKFKIDDHIVISTDNDPKKPYRVIMTTKIPRTGNFVVSHLLSAFFAILGLSILKLIIEALIFDRMVQISTRSFVIATFILAAMLPLISSVYLSTEFMVSSFKREKNRTAENLSNQLLNLDLETFATLRKSINRIKSLDSVEAIAKFTDMPVNADIVEIIRATLNKLMQINQKPLFSEIWVYEEGKSITGVELEKKNEYIISNNRNQLLNEIFTPKFKEYLTRSKTDNNSKEPTGKHPQIKLNEVKTEIIDDIMLSLFGEKTYFQIREDFGQLIALDSCFDSNSFISIPVKKNGKVHYIFSWVFTSSEIRRHFPLNKLNTAPSKPIIINIFGNDKMFSSIPEEINTLEQKFPALTKLAMQSHISTSRLVIQDSLATGSPIMETRPARYSDYIICGQSNTKSLETIQSELASQALRYFLAITTVGLLFAMLTSLYFTIPIKQLTKGTQEIINGNYSVRVSDKHPDEFAVAAKAFNKMAAALEEGKLLNNLVADSVRAIVTQNTENIASLATITTATVLFSSIKNFYEMQKSFEPEKIFAIMQAHLSAAVAATTLFGGEIDKMIEDKIMIVFAAEGSTRSEQSAAAIKTALHISKVMSEQSEIITAAGISIGEVVSGVMGAANVRLSKTVAGDPVNLAARLATEAGKLNNGGIVISGQICENMPANYSTARLPINTVKGKTQTIEAYLLQ